jgi:hypothetical protein
MQVNRYEQSFYFNQSNHYKRLLKNGYLPDVGEKEADLKQGKIASASPIAKLARQAKR